MKTVCGKLDFRGALRSDPRTAFKGQPHKSFDSCNAQRCLSAQRKGNRECCGEARGPSRRSMDEETLRDACGALVAAVNSNDRCTQALQVRWAGFTASICDMMGG